MYLTEVFGVSYFSAGHDGNRRSKEKVNFLGHEGQLGFSTLLAQKKELKSQETNKM